MLRKRKGNRALDGIGEAHGWVPMALAVGLAVLLVMAAAYAYTLEAKRSDRNTAERAYQNTVRIEAGLLGSCRRLQLLRERGNLSDARQYLFFRTAGANPKNPPRVRARYNAFATTAEYGPPTKCPQAIQAPLGYQPPRFVLYARLPVGYAVAVITAPKIGRGGVRQPTPAQWREHRAWWHRQALRTGVMP